MGRVVILLHVILLHVALGLKAETKDDCGKLLEHHPLPAMESLQTSPSFNQKALIKKASVLIINKYEEVMASFDLESYLPNSLYLEQTPTQLSWSADEKNLVVLPAQFVNQDYFVFFNINLDKQHVELKKIPFPDKVKTQKEKPGIYHQPQKLIWFPNTQLWAVRVEIQVGNYWPKKKEVMLLMDGSYQLHAVIGFRLDEGYKIGEIYQDQNNPQIVDIIFYHHQFTDRVIERWDLEQGLKISEHPLYVSYKPGPHFHMIHFAQRAYKNRATLDQYQISHVVKSPNGLYELHFTLANEPSNDNEPQKWAIDIIKRVDVAENAAPQKLQLQQSIPMEIDFNNLEFYWHREGEALIVKTNQSQVWLWNSQTQYFEVHAADNFEVHNDILYLYRNGKVSSFDLESYQLLPK